MDRRIALAVTLALCAPLLLIGVTKRAQAQPAGRCTRETLNVRGTPLTATYCITAIGSATPGRDLPVRVMESYATPHGSWSQEATLRFIAGEPASRVIEDVALERVGLRGTLHLTLLLHSGAVAVDSAMLTPGALTVK